MSKKDIPFLDLKAHQESARPEILKKFGDIIDRVAFVSGNYVANFEETFARYCGVKYCVAVNNGTSAIYVALRAFGVGPGDEVIVPVNTFIATAEAVSMVGAKPVFADINPDTYTIDITDVRRKMTERTKAIIPVHLYGQCAAMGDINGLAREHGVAVIEDSAQAHGAAQQGRRSGSLGTIGAFSFYPGKNLGAWGEGGAVTTDSEQIALAIKLLRNHGSLRDHSTIRDYQHELIGGNFRMSEFQGAVLETELPQLEAWNEKRRGHSARYCSLLQNSQYITLPAVMVGNMPVWHLFVIQAEKRDQLRAHLQEQGIQTGIHYPAPLHLTPAYKHLGYYRGDFPVAERVQRRILSLPMYPELSPDDVDYVCAAVNNFYVDHGKD